MSTPDPRFFGYGSLVNLATHAYHNPRPAQLAGWRRVWRHSTLRDVAFLSVERCAQGTVIDGIVADVPNADWAALDEREFAYLRRIVTDAVAHDGPRAETAVYEVDGGVLAPPSTAHPILLSYLDVVVQGFLRVFGPDGATRFFATTHGWDAPILNDRAAPRYPRAQTLTPDETATVDAALSRLRATVII